MSLCLAEHVVMWTGSDRFRGSIVGANMSKSPALENPIFSRFIWEAHLELGYLPLPDLMTPGYSKFQLIVAGPHPGVWSVSLKA